MACFTASKVLIAICGNALNLFRIFSTIALPKFLRASLGFFKAPTNFSTNSVILSIITAHTAPIAAPATLNASMRG